MRFDVKDAVLAAGLAAITAIAFAPVVDYPFIRLDDYGYVADNARVQAGPTLDNLAWAWSAFEMANWHPLTWWSHMVDWSIHGDDAGGHHLTNLILHIVNALLLFAVLRRITDTRWCSVWVAALFAVHPLHVETVAWIAERKDVLSTLFGLLALAAYAGWARKGGLPRYVLVLLCFVASLASKPMLVTLPLVFVLLDYGVFDRIPAPYGGPAARNATLKALGRSLLEKIPLLVLSIASSVLTMNAQRGALADVEGLPLAMRTGNAAISYGRYLAKTIWPTDLSIFYTYPGLEGGRGWATWQIALAVSGLVLASCAVLLLRRRWAVAAWFVYLGTLVPVIGLVQVGRQAMADRYTYVPLIGVFALVAWGAAELRSKLGGGRASRAVLAVVALGIVAASAAGARYQLGYWRDSITLFEHGLAISPNALTLHNNLGIERTLQQDWARAEEHFRRSLEIEPNGPEANFNLGRLLAGQGRPADAIDYLARSVEFEPGRSTTRFQLAIALRQTGRAAESIPHFREAARLDPGSIAALNQAAWLLATYVEESLRDPAAALGFAERAAALTNHSDAAALDTLAAALAANGRFDEAVQTAERALGIAEKQGNRPKADALRCRIAGYREGRAHITTR